MLRRNIVDIGYEERVVAGVAIVDHVTIQTLDHFGDVIVLVGHECQFARVARVGGLTFPAFDERHVEISL